MDSEVMQNPINLKLLVWPAITAIATFIASITIITLQHGFSINAVIIATPVCLFVFIISGCVWNCIRRPKTVEINDDGMILHMRYGRGKEFVRWSDIKHLSIFLIPEGPQRGQDGYIHYGNNINRTIIRPIALAARERYKDILGKYPPMRPGYPQ